MALKIELFDKTHQLPRGVKTRWLKLGQAVLTHHHLSGSFVVAVEVISNSAIRRLNNDFRSIDKATDVLSFPNYNSLAELKASSEKSRFVGDLAISLEKTKRQALEYGHSFEREISFLFVHGLLHLLGYDHQDEVSETRMFALQEQILQEAGIRR